MKKEFFNYLTYVKRKGLKVMHTNTLLSGERREFPDCLFAIMASNTETLESR